MGMSCSKCIILPSIQNFKQSAKCTMLSIQEKKPLPIQTSIVTSTTMDKELSELLESRHRLVQSKSSCLESRLHQLCSYYDSLSKINPCYTTALERSGLETISFFWQDSFKSSKSYIYSHTSINSEKIAVAFNIAAVHSQMAITESWPTQQGLKVAFKEFNYAAAALRFLNERLGGGEFVDVSRGCVYMLETLMLAQAQECIFQTAVMSGKSPTACSKAARQVELCYEEVQSALTAAPLNGHFNKASLAHVQLKVSLFYAASCYHCAIDLHRRDCIGEEIARLWIGINHLQDTRKVIRGGSSSLIEVVTRLERIMNLSLHKAEYENNSIYYQRVPAVEALSDLPGCFMERPPQLKILTALEDSANQGRSRGKFAG